MKKVLNGILLRKINYSETSLILHFYTLEKGFQAYIFKGAKKKKGNLLQALSHVEITSFRRRESSLGMITEVSPNYLMKSIPFHPIKSSVAFFMTEVLAQLLNESDQDEDMFHFLSREIEWLDSSHELANYPLWFLIGVSQRLGISINIIDEAGATFDLQEGTISNNTPKFPFFIRNETVPILVELLLSDRIEFLSKPIHRRERKEILDILLKYLHIHFPTFKPLKSLPIIEVVLEA